MFSAKKMVLAGNVLHLYDYQRPIKYGQKEQNKGITYSEHDKESSSSETIYHLYRVKKYVKNLVEANAGRYQKVSGKDYKPVFVTLTFKENVTDIRRANAIYTAFIKRLNYQVFKRKRQDLKYIVVPELQKRGAVHYHIVFFNLPWIAQVYNFFREVWGQGAVNVKTVRNRQHLVNYVTKYISKDISSQFAKNTKRYMTSKGLYKPQEMYNQDIITYATISLPSKPKFEHTYQTETLGQVNYKFYRLTDKQLQVFKQSYDEAVLYNNF